MFGWTLLFICLCSNVQTSQQYYNDNALTFLNHRSSFINHINSIQNYWRAGRNFALNISPLHLKRLTGVHKRTKKLAHEKKHDDNLITSLPEEFDARDKWPECPTLREIRDQGSCSSCWAISAAEIISDRICIYSNGKQRPHISAEDMLSCCTSCGDGCGGGRVDDGLHYWSTFGVVTGGNYQSGGCLPYQVPPCEHDIIGMRMPCSADVKTPRCMAKCQNNYNGSWSQDKYFGKRIFSLPSDEGHIKAEIFKYGPVQAVMVVYSDMLTYKSGVYRHVHGEKIGRHAIKIMGWGVQNGQKYWLVANSWNSDWGDGGFFRILRGEDHCGIESEVVAGEPQLIRGSQRH